MPPMKQALPGGLRGKKKKNNPHLGIVLDMINITKLMNKTKTKVNTTWTRCNTSWFGAM